VEAGRGGVRLVAYAQVQLASCMTSGFTMRNRIKNYNNEDRTLVFDECKSELKINNILFKKVECLFMCYLFISRASWFHNNETKRSKRVYYNI
jgi:hypothetical protein